MKKKALLAVLLAMTLLLSSCGTLIVKDQEVDAKTVILKMGDKEVTKAEVQEATNDVLAEMHSYYAMYGSYLDITDPEVIAQAQASAIADLKEDMVLRAKATELGFDELTEDEIAEMKETAQNSLDNAKSYIQMYYLDDPDLEGEELEKAIQEKLDEFGVSLETYEQVAADEIRERKLFNYATENVDVPDEDVKADFDSKVAADEEKYKEDAASWVTADRNKTATLYYTPAGIRRVKQILVKFKEEDQLAIDEANSKITEANSRVTAAEAIIDDPDAAEEDKTQAQEDLTAAQADLEAANAELEEATEKAYAGIDEDTDAILEALEADPESWDQLMAEKNEDPGLQEGAANAEKGYAVCETMTGFDPAFVEAAMALENVGDHSDKIRGASGGYYIIKYVSDEPEGPVEYDDAMKDTLYQSLLSTKKNEVYNEVVDQWISEAKIQENLGAMKD